MCNAWASRYGSLRVVGVVGDFFGMFVSWMGIWIGVLTDMCLCLCVLLFAWNLRWGVGKLGIVPVFGSWILSLGSVHKGR